VRILEIEQIVKSMTDYQKGNIKLFYEWYKKGLGGRGTRAGKPMEKSGLIKYAGYNRYNAEYRLSELGMKVAEHLLLQDLAEKEELLLKHPDWVSGQNTLESLKKKLIDYGLISA
jgi:hypothetical protein